MATHGWKLGACLVAASLYACGPKADNNENNTNNNTNNNNNTTNNTANTPPHNTANSTSNNPPNNTNNPPNNTNNPPNVNTGPDADVMEVEPNGFEDAWTPFEPGQTIGGTIATGAGETSDFDVFTVNLTAGTVIEFGFEATGPGLTDTAVVMVQDENGEFLTRIAGMSEGPAIRQAYIPIDGAYMVAVYDERATGEEPQQHGGDDSWYVVSLNETSVAPTATEIPSTTAGDQSDGAIQIYEVSTADDALVVAEVTADRPPISSTLDSVVWVINAASGEIVGFDDDGAGGESYDSRAIFSAEAGVTYQIVVDSWFGTNTGAYSLALTETDDDISAPTTLEIGTPGSGVIDAVDGDDFDTDYFLITLEPGQTVRVVVTGAGGLEPAVTAVVNTFFGLIPFATGYAVGDDAAIEFTHSSEAEEAGDYYLFVDDVRNIADPDNPGDVGEAGYAYTIEASLTTWSSTPVTLPYTTAGSIANVGNYVWYSFTVPAGHLFSATATSPNADFVAGIATLTEGGNAFTDIGTSSLFPQAEVTLTMGVRDQFFRGGAGWDFTPNFQSFDIGAISFTAVTETEPNDGAGDAQVVTPPAAVAGVLDGMGEGDLRPDWFRVTAAAGQSIGVITGAGADAAMDDADTVVTIYAPDGTTVLGENDDYDGQESSFFSALVVTADAAGDYYVVVTPYCVDPDDCSGNGDYTASIFVQ